MNRYADEAHRLLFRTRFAYLQPPMPVQREAQPDAASLDTIKLGLAEPDLIIMSRSTAHYIMWSEAGGNVVRRGADKSKPDTIFGVRIAYDDSLSEGEMRVAVLLGSG